MIKLICSVYVVLLSIVGFTFASGTITKSFTSVSYKNGTFFTKSQVCKLGNVVSMSGVEFKYVFPANSTDQRGYIDGFVKQKTDVFYLARVEYYINKKHIVEHQLFSYNCVTKKPSALGTGLSFTGVMQYPGDSNLFVRYVDVSSKTALFELRYEGPAQYYLVNLASGKVQVFNPKLFVGQDRIDEIVTELLNNMGEEIRKETLSRSCINCGGYYNQMIYSIGSIYSAPDGKLSSYIRIYKNSDFDKPYVNIPIVIDMKKKYIGVR